MTEVEQPSNGIITHFKFLKINQRVKIIKIKNYNRKSNYSLPIKPSPNLPNDKSINLYPSLCLFEGTNVSIGRGTKKPFQHFWNITPF